METWIEAAKSEPQKRMEREKRALEAALVAEQELSEKRRQRIVYLETCCGSFELQVDMLRNKCARLESEVDYLKGKKSQGFAVCPSLDKVKIEGNDDTDIEEEDEYDA